MSGVEFWGGAAPSAENGSFHYFFSPVGDLPAALRRDVDTSRLSTPFQPVVEANLWAGSAGVASPLHFDAAHNVYAQLRGRKRFVLFPADVSDDLYVFPRLHPSTRQSRLDLRALPPAGFGRFHRRRAARTEDGGVRGGGALHARGGADARRRAVHPAVRALRRDARRRRAGGLRLGAHAVDGDRRVPAARRTHAPPDWSRAQRAALGEYVLARRAAAAAAGATTADAADASLGAPSAVAASAPSTRTRPRSPTAAAPRAAAAHRRRGGGRPAARRRRRRRPAPRCARSAPTASATRRRRSSAAPPPRSPPRATRSPPSSVAAAAAAARRRRAPRTRALRAKVEQLATVPACRRGRRRRRRSSRTSWPRPRARGRGVLLARGRPAVLA